MELPLAVSNPDVGIPNTNIMPRATTASVVGVPFAPTVPRRAARPGTCSTNPPPRPTRKPSQTRAERMGEQWWKNSGCARRRTHALGKRDEMRLWLCPDHQHERVFEGSG